MIDILHIAFSLLLLCSFLFAFNYNILIRTHYFDRFFYRQVDHIINAKDNGISWPGYHLEHGFSIVFFGVTVLSILDVAYRMHQYPELLMDDGVWSNCGSSSCEVRTYDFAFYFLSQFTTPTDHYFVYLAGAMFVYFAYCEWRLFYTRTDTITWQKFNDLAIENFEIYERCLVKRWSAKRKEYYVRFDRQKFASTKLTHLSTLSVRTRLRFIERINLMDRFIQVTNLGLAMALNFILPYYLITYSKLIPIYLHPLLAVNLFLGSNNIFDMCKVAGILIHCNQACFFLYTTHLNEATARLRQLLLNFRQKSGRLFQETKSHFTQYCLCYFLREHTNMVVVVNTVNGELWGGLLWYTILLNFSPNAYLLYRFLHPFNSNFGIQQMVVTLLLTSQFGLILVSLLALASASKAFHKAKSFLPAIQLSLKSEDRKYLLYKLKYMELFERINSEKKYGNSIGSMATVTYSVAFELGLFYFGFIFKVFDVLNSRGNQILK